MLDSLYVKVDAHAQLLGVRLDLEGALINIKTNAAF